VGNDPINMIDPTGENGVAAAAGIAVRVAWVACSAHPECREKAAQAAEKIAEKAVDIWIGDPPTTTRDKYSKKRNSSEQKKFREQSIENNKTENNGELKCEKCNKSLRENTGKVGSGQKVPDDQAQAHHKDENRENNDAKNNGQILCPPCHIEEHKK
jgi:hypothetical protein